MKLPLLLILLSFFTLLINSQEPPVVIPQWSCWFHTYLETNRLVNLVFSYQNTGPSDQIINTGTMNNQITPQSLDGNQNNIFKSGSHPFAFTLLDRQNILLSNSSSSSPKKITWTLNGQAVSVSSADLLLENRCDTKYGGLCPLNIDHFCEDSLYCNGLESCFTPNIFEAMTSQRNGTCARPHIGVVCQPGFICQEESRSCIDNTPPPPPAPKITPSFDCWYYHYDEASSTMIISLLLSYNNSGEGPIIRPITLPSQPSEPSLRNEISPSAYNQVQPTLFYPGFNKGAFTLRDTATILNSPGGTIQWRLTTEELSFSRNDITLENQCNTNSPTTQSSNETEAPTSAGEEEEETEAPTSDSDGRVHHTRQCTEENPDCSAYDSYCNGPTQCDTVAEICVQTIHAYSPCHSAASSISKGAPIAVVCVERAAICISSTNCTTDRECKDGLLCNGRESCINMTCVPQANFTCGPNQICIEGQGCVAVNQTLSNPAIGGIIIAVTGGCIIVAGIFGWFFYDRQKMVDIKSKNG